VVIGEPAEDEPWSEDVVVVSWLCATLGEVCDPIDPETPITPKAIAKVASEVAQTRRRMARSLAPRTRSFSAASSRGVGVGFMHPMVGRQSKHVLKAAWELPESAQVA
jgi:hypothetical protein